MKVAYLNNVLCSFMKRQRTQNFFFPFIPIYREILVANLIWGDYLFREKKSRQAATQLSKRGAYLIT